jgi:hypothetical protein
MPEHPDSEPARDPALGDEPEDDPFAEAPASPEPIVEWQPNRRRLAVGPARSSGALAVGALALAVFATGALVIGTLAIGRLAVGRARVRTLHIDRLIVGRIERG